MSRQVKEIRLDGSVFPKCNGHHEPKCQRKGKICGFFVFLLVLHFDCDCTLVVMPAPEIGGRTRSAAADAGSVARLTAETSAQIGTLCFHAGPDSPFVDLTALFFRLWGEATFCANTNASIHKQLFQFPGSFWFSIQQ